MSNLNLNKVVLAGRLTAEPELKQTPSGISVVRVSIAVNRRRRGADQNDQQQTDFISIVAWRQTAEFISKYFRKGAAICVTGSIQTSSWTDQQGQKRYATDIVADEVQFVDSRAEGSGYDNVQQGGYTPDAYSTPSFSSTANSAPNFEEVASDDDLPF